MKKRILLITLIGLFFLMLPVMAGAEIVDQGSCGETLFWTLDRTGILSISGSGEMADYESAEENPWYNHRGDILQIVFENGISSIGNYAFYECSVSEVSLPTGVTTIGDSAFAYCTNLRSIFLPETVNEIDARAFYTCSSLMDILIPNGVTAIQYDAFSECHNLQSVVIPDSVITIDSYAFNYCYSLENVTIPDSVTSIGYEAFHECSNLKDITLPDSVTQLEAYAFAGCTNLTEIVIPSSVTNIGSGAFSNCSSLTGITFQGNAPQFNGDTFSNVTATVYYPDADDSWTEETRQNYGGSLTWIPYGTDDRRYGDPEWTWAEDYLSAMATFTCLDEDYTRVMNAAVVRRYLTWPTVTQDGCIAYTARILFQGTEYTDAREVIIPAGDYPPSIAWEISDGHAIITGYSDELPEDLVIPAEINGVPVTEIGSSAFYGCSSIRSVTFPNTLRTIGYLAFNGCDNLRSMYITDLTAWCEVEFPDYDSHPFISNWTNGGGTIYLNGEAITTLEIPEGVTSIRHDAFFCCSNLTSVIIPDSVTSIGEGAFFYCNGLESVTFGREITSIGIRAFENSTLTSIMFQGSAPQISSDCFNYVTATVYYPEDDGSWTDSIRQDYGGSLTWIPYGTDDRRYGDPEWTWAEDYLSATASFTCMDEDYTRTLNAVVTRRYVIRPTTTEDGLIACTARVVFRGTEYTDEREVTVPAGEYLVGLTWETSSDHVTITGFTDELPDEVFIPAMVEGLPVTEIGEYAFDGCNNLTGITFPDSVTRIGVGALRSCSSLTSVTLPESLTSIEGVAFGGTFDGCSSLTSIVIPNSVTSIGDGAFSGCSSLTNVVIPDSVTSIGDGAFSYCSSLTDITIPNGVTSIHSWTFEHCSNLMNFTIPDGVTSIGYRAFNQCNSLTSILIPDSVMSIEGEAFLECNGLTSITFQGSAPQLDNSCYTDVTATVYYPDTDDSWTEDVRQDYGGSLTWVSYGTDDRVYGEPEWSWADDYLTATAIFTCPDDGYTWTLNATVTYQYVSWPTMTEDGCIAYTARVVFQGMEYIDEKEVTVPAGEYPSNHGMCGANVFWTLSDDALLTISGTGAMEDYCSSWIDDSWITNAPWGTGVVRAVIEDGVTYICDSAFRGCTNLTSIVIPDSVTNIGPAAFAGCTSLTSITIPDGVTSIGSEAFDYCNAVRYAHVDTDGARALSKAGYGFREPGQVYDLLYIYSDDNETIGLGISKLDKDVVSVSIPDGVISICDSAFSYCTSLTEIVIPNSVTDIRSGAFSSCSSLTSITFQGNAPKLDDSCFIDVTATVYYPDADNSWTWEVCKDYGGSLTWVPYGTDGRVYGDPEWAWADDLLSATAVFTCPDDGYIRTRNASVTHYHATWPTATQDGRIVYTARVFFRGMDYSDTKEVIIPAGDYPPSLTWEIDGDHANITGYSDELPNDLVIPAEINGVPVTEIGSSAFYGCNNLRSVTFPSTLRTIGYLAFNGCGNLRSMYITDLAAWCEVEFPDYDSHPFISNWTNGGGTIYLNGEAITTLEIPEGVTSIRHDAFFCCSNLTSVIIPDSVTSIGEGAFFYCNGLESVTFGSGITSIGIRAFENSALTSIMFQGSAPQISSDCFNYVTATVYYPEDDGSWTDSIRQDYGGSLTWIPYGTDDRRYGDPEWTWAEDYLSATASFTCMDEDYTRTLNAMVIHQYISWPSETEEGLITYTARVVFQGTEYTDEKEVIVPAGEYTLDYGMCGANVFWTLGSNGVLTISGTGEMNDYDNGSPPWETWKNQIRSIVIESGVTSIGTYAFYCYDSVEHLLVPGSVNHVGYFAVHGMTGIQSAGPIGSESDYEFGWTEAIPDNALDSMFGLTRVVFPDGLLHIGNDTVSMNSLITEIVLPDSLVSIGSFCFYNNSSLATIRIPKRVETIGESAFSSCSSLSEVYYDGTEAEWGSIDIGYNNGALTGATIYYAHIHDDDHEWIFDLTDCAFTDDFSSVTVAFHCRWNPNHLFTATSSVSLIDEQAPTCVDWGSKKYYAYEFTGEGFPNDVYIEVPVEPLGHNWGEVQYNLMETEYMLDVHCPADYPMQEFRFMGPGSVYAYRECTNCVFDENGNEIWHCWETKEEGNGYFEMEIVQEATCTEEGLARFTAQFDNDLLEPLTEERIIDAIGHIEDRGEGAVPELNEDGTIMTVEIYCFNCDEHHTESTEVSSVELITEPTCDSEGMFQYYAPLDLRMPYVEVPVDSLGHDWGEPAYIWNWENMQVTAEYVCKRDGTHVETETVDVTAVIISPSEDTEGSATYTSAEFSKAGFIIQTKNIVIPALKEMSVMRLPSMLIIIEEEAFENLTCDAIIVPNSCTSIGDHAFRNCRNLKYIRVPADVEIPSNAFEGCENVVIDRTAE